jgi:hypothetical protein
MGINFSKKLFTVSVTLGFVFVVNSGHASDEFAGKNPAQIRAMAIQYKAQALAAAAGPVAPGDFGVLATCVETGNNVPYIELAKAKIKEILANDAPGAVISDATPNKATLLQQLNVFIDTLNSNAALGLAPNVAAPGNDNAHLVSARKAAIDVAMVQKVNEKMDELVGAGAQPIKDALIAVFAGR